VTRVWGRTMWTAITEESRSWSSSNKWGARCIATILALASVWTAACARNRATTDPPMGERLFPIKTWTRTDCSATPWAVAQHEGFLAQERVAIQWTNEIQPALQIPSILRGDNDVAVLRPDTLAVAKAAGARISAVAEADIDPTDPVVDARFRHLWWFVHPGKHPDVRRFADLAGVSATIRVATLTSNIGAHLETKRLAERYGIPKSKIEWVTMPGLQAVQALKQGEIDVSEIDSAFFKAMADAGARKIADSSETNLGAAGGITYYVFRDEFIRQHAERVAAFARAMTRAQRWIDAHPDDAIRVTEKTIGVSAPGNHYYSTSLRVDDSYPVPWLAELEAAHVIAHGTITVSDLIAHDIEKMNMRFE